MLTLHNRPLFPSEGPLPRPHTYGGAALKIVLVSLFLWFLIVFAVRALIS
jgi:hypothetical protein